jgi:hypothetical protein
MFDASIRYGDVLEELDIWLKEPSLLILLHISKIPAFRDRVKKIHVHKSEAEINPGFPEYELHGLTKEEVNAKQEHSDIYHNSPELIYLLGQCLSNLRCARMLEKVETDFEGGANAVLAACHLTKFPRKLINISIHSKAVQECSIGKFLNSPATYAPYIKGLAIEEPGIILRDPLYTVDGLLNKLREKLVNNDLGYHVRNYRPSHPTFSKLLEELHEIDELAFSGCSSWARLRFCHGCHDLFVYNFTRAIYPHLTTLRISKMYISGGRLRRFIKVHEHTLYHVELDFTTLTDGSWKSIAQGLFKLSKLSHVHLGFRLCQKKSFPLLCQLPDSIVVCDRAVCRYGVSVAGAEFIRQFLLAFVKYFHTSEYVCDFSRGTSAKYHEIRFFKPIDVLTIPHFSRHSSAALKSYTDEI